jgi:hypothetical protein
MRSVNRSEVIRSIYRTFGFQTTNNRVQNLLNEFGCKATDAQINAQRSLLIRRPNYQGHDLVRHQPNASVLIVNRSETIRTIFQERGLQTTNKAVLRIMKIIGVVGATNQEVNKQRLKLISNPNYSAGHCHWWGKSRFLASSCVLKDLIQGRDLVRG